MLHIILRIFLHKLFLAYAYVSHIRHTISFKSIDKMPDMLGELARKTESDAQRYLDCLRRNARGVPFIVKQTAK